MKIVQPTLTLTYPDYVSNKVKLLAATRNRKTLKAFKEAVLEDIQLNLLTYEDKILKIELVG